MQRTTINGLYELLLPEHRAARPEWDMKNGGWEVERIEEMLDLIYPEDVVFDIGTEEGDISALLAKYSKCKMVLIEPNERVWSCIKAIWEANQLPAPEAFYSGFMCNETKLQDKIKFWYEIGDLLIPDHGFKHLSENYPDVPQIKMDDFCEAYNVFPDVITMDVEGSEFEVIKGAEKTLREKRPTIFMSLHPEFMYEMYRHSEEDAKRIGEPKQYCNQLLRFVDDCGYKHRVIEWDYHECHIRFDPK